MRRRSFLKQVTTIPTLSAVIPYIARNDYPSVGAQSGARFTPGRILNEYNHFLPLDTGLEACRARRHCQCRLVPHLR